MIAFAKPQHSVSKSSLQAQHAKFLAMLPRIRRYASLAFRCLNPDLREELVAEVVANAFVAYSRLVEQGKGNLAFPNPLARFAIKQVRAGRKVGGQLNIQDVASYYCRSRKGIPLERLDRFVSEDLVWREVLVEDRRAGPAETAASRIDFSDWLRTLTSRQRKIATTLAMGESTQTAVAFHGPDRGVAQGAHCPIPRYTMV